MRRVTALLERRRGTAGHDEGAVAFLVVLLLPVIFGFAALAMDVSNMYLARVQVQNGADAAAIAIAEACAGGDCGDMDATVAELADLNKFWGSGVTGYDVERDGRHVRVTVDTVVPHYFAGIIGIPSSPVSAFSQASYGGLSETDANPFAFNRCTFDELVLDQPGMVRFSATNTHGDCGGGDGGGRLMMLNSNFPGAFCAVSSEVGDWIQVSANPSGKVTPPSGCSTSQMNKLLRSGEPLLIPVVDNSRKVGNKYEVQVAGYAAVEVGEYCLSPAIKTSTLSPQCVKADPWFEGRFVSYLGRVGAGDASAPDFGVRTVGLTE